MSRPCTCDKPGCHLCRLWRIDPRYRALWSQPETRFLEETGFLEQTPPRGALRPLPCMSLGKLVSKAGCSCPRQDIRHCDWLETSVRQAVECETCEHYEVDQ